MTYRVLARKWRPSRFADLVGQEHVLKALQNALDKGRVHHAYLLTGTRGVGKTTIARILARCFNCVEGPTAEPCGECSACVEVSEGRSIDLIEVDAASRTKVEDTRELLENSQFAPTQGRYKIFLIDEVHMLSSHSFNALLKTLEEPPPHIIFIFATTHPQKIPVTVLSRCLQFHLKNLQPAQISEHLAMVLGEEQIEYEDEALALIAHAAQGSMRDALSITEQAIAFGEESVSSAQVSDMLGIIDADISAALLRAVIAGDSPAALAVVREFASHSIDFGLLIDALLGLLHRIGLEQLHSGLGSEAQLQHASITEFAASLEPTLLQIFYQALLHGKRDLQLAPDPLTGIEMVIMRMLAFKPLTQGAAAGLQHSPEPSSPEPNSPEPSSAERNSPEQYSPEPSPVSDSGAAKKKPSELGAATREFAEPPTSAATPEPPSIESLSKEALSAEPLHGDSEGAFGADIPLEDFTNALWCERFSSMPVSGLVRAVMERCQWRGVNLDGDVALVKLMLLASDADLYKPEHSDKLAKSLQIVFARPIVIELTTAEDIGLMQQLDDGLTPAEFRKKAEIARREQAISSIQEDANVKKILSTFDAALDIESIDRVDNIEGSSDA